MAAAIRAIRTLLQGMTAKGWKKNRDRGAQRARSPVMTC